MADLFLAAYRDTLVVSFPTVVARGVVAASQEAHHWVAHHNEEAVVQKEVHSDQAVAVALLHFLAEVLVLPDFLDHWDNLD